MENWPPCQLNQFDLSVDRVNKVTVPTEFRALLCPAPYTFVVQKLVCYKLNHHLSLFGQQHKHADVRRPSWWSIQSGLEKSTFAWREYIGAACSCEAWYDNVIIITAFKTTRSPWCSLNSPQEDKVVRLVRVVWDEAVFWKCEKSNGKFMIMNKQHVGANYDVENVAQLRVIRARLFLAHFLYTSSFVC